MERKFGMEPEKTKSRLAIVARKKAKAARQAYVDALREKFYNF